MNNELEKELLASMIGEFVGDKKAEFMKMVDKLSKGIKDNQYYFMYRDNEQKLTLVVSDKTNVEIDIKDPEKAKVTDLSEYEELIKNI